MKDLVNNLYKFLKEDVKDEQLFEADKKIRRPEMKVVDIGEGRLPGDPSTDPEGYIGDLREEKDKEEDKKKSEKGVAGEIPPAAETDDNKDSKVEKELAKETPELKDSKALKQQEEQGEGKDGDEQLKAAGKKEVEVTKEGRVPKDPTADNPENKKALKEATPREKELTSMSDEASARDLAAKYPGGRVVPDAQARRFIVVVPESVNEDEDQQAVPKTTVAMDNKTDDVKPDSGPAMASDADSQAGSPGAKSVDQQSVPKADVQADANVTSVATTAAPAQPADAGSQVGSPVQSPVQGQAVPKASAEQGAGVSSVGKSPAPAMKEAEIPQQQQVPKTSVAQGAKIDDVKPCGCAGGNCECTEKKKKAKPVVTGVKNIRVKEDTEVNVKTDDKEVSVIDAGGATTVTTSDASASTANVGLEPIPEPDKEGLPAEELPAVEEPELSDEETTEMAERMLLIGHLRKKPKLTSREKAFLVASESRKLSEKNRTKVEQKLAKMLKK